MTISSAALQPGATLTGSLSAIVTAAGTGRTVITQAVFANPTGAAVSLQVTVTRSGGSSLVIVPTRSIATLATDIPDELAVFSMGPGDVIYALGAGLNVFVSGYTAT